MNNNSFDPWNCSIEELEKEIERLKGVEAFENDVQLAVKIFINSVYGATGAQFYNLYNPNIAESITLQGQDLIKFSLNIIEDYVYNKWHLDYESHIKLAELMKAKYNDFDTNKFLVLAKNQILKGKDLAVGGDSVTGDTKIATLYGNIEIETLFNNANTLKFIGDKEYRTLPYKIYNVDENNSLKISDIKYIIRHKTSKLKWELCCNDYKINVTDDHSLIVMRNGKQLNVKPNEVFNTDKLIIFENKNVYIKDITYIKCLGNFNNEYVYDIEVDTTNINEHNFFGNNILVHNTDSVSGNSLVYTEKHKDGITIEEFYNENIDNFDRYTDKGHEMVFTNDKVLNWDKNLYNGNVGRIIRHKVNKEKWQLKTKSGKIVECTNDHSLIVFRNGEKISVKPYEIQKGDKVLTIKKAEVK